MKAAVVSADVLFEQHRESLHWQWIAGQIASERRFDEVAVTMARSGADLVGYLNYIHPYRLQVLGEREVNYLTNATPEDCRRRVSRIVTLEPPVLVVADGQTAPDALVSMCERAQIPLFATHESAGFVIDVLRAYLSRHFAERVSMHGVFMDILGVGVMITGESGLGKSELGLELISRGHGLIADDAVDLYRTNQTTIEGRCPELLQNLLEVRGIGLGTSRPSLARRPCAARCASSSSCTWCGQRPWSATTTACPTSPCTRMCWVCPCANRSSRWWRAATSLCWWKLRCATWCCSCAASTPTSSLCSVTATR